MNAARLFWRASVLYLLPAGRSARVVVGWLLLIIAAGRFDLLTRSSPSQGTVLANAVLVLGSGLALLFTLPWRELLLGRVVAGLGAIVLMGLVWDVRTFGVSMAIELSLSFVLLVETFANRRADC